jgi:hypothetical protein
LKRSEDLLEKALSPPLHYLGSSLKSIKGGEASPTKLFRSGVALRLVLKEPEGSLEDFSGRLGLGY